MTKHNIRILRPENGRPTFVLTVQCGECRSPMKLSRTATEGQSRWHVTTFDCPTCKPRQTAEVRWDAPHDQENDRE